MIEIYNVKSFISDIKVSNKLKNSVMNFVESDDKLKTLSELYINVIDEDREIAIMLHTSEDESRHLFDVNIVTYSKVENVLMEYSYKAPTVSHNHGLILHSAIILLPYYIKSQDSSSMDKAIERINAYVKGSAHKYIAQEYVSERKTISYGMHYDFSEHYELIATKPLIKNQEGRVLYSIYDKENLMVEKAILTLFTADILTYSSVQSLNVLTDSKYQTYMLVLSHHDSNQTGTVHYLYLEEVADMVYRLKTILVNNKYNQAFNNYHIILDKLGSLVHRDNLTYRGEGETILEQFNHDVKESVTVMSVLQGLLTQEFMKFVETFGFKKAT